MSFPNLIESAQAPYFAMRRQVSIYDQLIVLKSLPFDMQPQTESNWCWAATSRSVSKYYWKRTTWTQCKIACGELDRNDCCRASVPDECNVIWYLDKALKRTNNFVSITGVATFDDVRKEINMGRPVGARVGWNGGGGHFMVIHGWAVVRGRQYFDIDDPIYGKSTLSVSDFTNSYQSSGSWTHTYYTQSYLPFVIFKPVHIAHELLEKLWPERALLAAKDPGPVEPVEAAMQRSVGLAHEVFTIELQQLRGDEPSPQRCCLRVLEFEGERPRALFDVDPREDEAPVRQMSGANPYLALFPRALEAAAAAFSRSEIQCEPRLLRVPALSFEGLWLHFEKGEEDDYVIPLRTFHGFREMQPLPYREVIKRLREAALKLGEMDDLKGA